jgi:hypothetical protein
MAKTRIWQEGDSWSKVAYLETFDSRNFRKILKLNPSFDIRTYPAPGVPILVSQSGVGSKGVGTINQLDLTLDLRRSNSNSNLRDSIYPWETLSEFTSRLTEYTAAALLQSDRTNGFSLDSPQALRGPRK